MLCFQNVVSKYYVQLERGCFHSKGRLVLLEMYRFRYWLDCNINDRNGRVSRRTGFSQGTGGNEIRHMRRHLEPRIKAI